MWPINFCAQLTLLGISGNFPGMSKDAVRKHREHRRRLGLVRVELQVPKEDIPALRALGKRLRNPATARAARLQLHCVSSVEVENPYAGLDLKTLITRGPEFELPERHTDVLRSGRSRESLDG